MQIRAFVGACLAALLSLRPGAATESAGRDLAAEFRRGSMAGVEEIVFAVRRLGEDPHWYANFGSTLDHSRWRTYLDGGRLCRLNLRSGKVTVLLEDARGFITTAARSSSPTGPAARCTTISISSRPTDRDSAS